MSRRNVILAAGLGIVTGFLLRDQLDNFSKLSPEKALQYAKETFQKNWPINGSWIYMKPERLEKNGLTYYTYRGGISRNIDGKNEQYEFFSDQDTGTIIDVKKID